MRKIKSILALVLVLTMVLGCIGTAFAGKLELKVEGFGNEEPNSDKSLKKANLAAYRSEKFNAQNTYKYADDEIVRAIVLLEGKSESEVAEAGSEKAAAQRVKLVNEHNAVLKAMAGINYKLQREFTTLLNGFSCDVAYGDLDAIAALAGVKSVHIANRYEAPKLAPDADEKMIYANMMTGNAYSVNDGFDGTGIVVAVLDTGLNLDHEAFQDSLEYCAAYGRLTAEDIEAVAGELKGAGAYVNAKVPFAFDYADEDADVTDHDGHGTHVSGIVAGYTTAEAEDGAVEFTFMGGAPGAQLLSMKIFHDDEPGTTDDIYFDALEDAYLLGADVVNMSIGAQNGFTYDESLEEVLGNIYQTLSDNGVILSVAAGNEYSMAEFSTMGYIGPEYTDYGTVASPSTYLGSVSVASVENIAYPSLVIQIDGANLLYVDSSTEEKDNWLKNFGDKTMDFAPVLNADGSLGFGYEEDYATNDVTGKIAVVSRGDITFEEKVEFAANAGAIGCIVVNNEEGQMISMQIETFEIPAISMGLEALEVIMASESKKIVAPTEKQYIANPEGAMMSTFSNWGTSPMLTLAPAITSVGGRVYSTYIGGEDVYEVASGTSMAAPNASATYANVLSVIYYVNPDMDKAEASELAKALLASSAYILTDADDYCFSPRKQGAGLADSTYAADNYLTAGYIVDPLKELGDDPEKTGIYEFSVTVKNTCGEDRYYSNFTADILTDWIDNVGTEEYPVIGNKLLADTCEAEVTYSIDGALVEEFYLPADAEVSIDICIKLSEEQKEYFDTYYENGAFVEGYITFFDMEDGETFTDVHATFLAYYGSWAAAPAMEALNSFDYLEAEYLTYNYPIDAEGNTYADYGYTPLDLLVALTGENLYTDLNYAYQYDTYYEKAINYLGGNLLDLSLETHSTEFFPEHIAITTPKADGTYYYTDSFYLAPNLLRNVRHIVMTVTDAQTGEVYLVDDTEYIPKSIYSQEEEYWQNASMFMWDGTDAEGNYVPSGTVANITFDVQVPWGEDANIWQEDVWTFDCTVDYKAPEITDIVLDEEAQTLTVTATDDQYLAGIYLANANYEIIDAVTFSSDKQGETFTATFNIDGIEAAYVTAMDYATNETEYWTEIGEHVCPGNFTDIDVNAWYHEYVDAMVEAGIMNGMTATTFEPEGTLTRAQVATMLYRIFGEEAVDGYEEPFTDVNEADWFYSAIVWNYNMGIINGMSATEFAPNAKITREQLAVMLYRVSTLMGIAEKVDPEFSAYEDADKVSNYAVEALAWACDIGLINGISYDNSGKLYLAPQGDATRAQAAKILTVWLIFALS